MIDEKEIVFRQTKVAILDMVLQATNEINSAQTDSDLWSAALALANTINSVAKCVLDEDLVRELQTKTDMLIKEIDDEIRGNDSEEKGKIIRLPRKKKK